MKSLRFRLTLLGGALLMLAFTSTASAQATRTWVSGVGDDANPCSRTAPCKTFAGAISKTAASGEIDCLDPGGFGAVTITKSITIDCDAGAGGVLNAGFNGVVISANAASDVIQLRNLSIQGAGSGLTGVLINSAKSVHLEDVVIMGQTTGIFVNATATANLTGRDVKINACGTGLSVTTTAGNAVVDFQNTQISGNGTGILGQGGSLITIKDSVLSINSGPAVSQSAAGSQINLVTSQLSSNATAVRSFVGSTIRVVGNVFAQNGVAINTNGGSVLSDGTNTNVGNGIVGSPSALPTPIKM